MNAGPESQGSTLENSHAATGVLSLMGSQVTAAIPGGRSGSWSNGGSSERREVHRDPSEEPPIKRLRRESSTPGGKRQALRERIVVLLLPYVDKAVRKLSYDELKHRDIAIKAASILAKHQSFRCLLDNDNNLRISEDNPLFHKRVAMLKKRVEDVVHQLASSPEFCRENRPRDHEPVVKEEEHMVLSITDIAPAVSRASKVPTGPTAPTVSIPSTLPTPIPTPALPPSHTNRPLRKPYKPRIRRNTSPRIPPQWTRLTTRPYLSAKDRDVIEQGSRLAYAKADPLRDGPAVYHVDFSTAEITKMVDEMAPYVQFVVPRTAAALWQLCIEYPVPSIIDGKLPGRTEQDIRNFCSDLLADRAADSKSAQVLSLSGETTPQRKEHLRESQVSRLLFARELEGNAGMGRTRHYVNFQSTFKQTREDAMSLVAEFTNCAGDISTMTWVPRQNILCGTTAHSDAHNQQYNKPGNLLLCSLSKGVLRAFSDHRIPRPLVAKGENSSVAMRQSQDPWIYSSVVSSDYDTIHGYTYTSSFDKTIKAWKVDEDGGSMEAVATFKHNGNVNFVAVAKDGSGRVAVAADTTTEAVRIYTMDPDNIHHSPYYTLSCSRTDADGSDKWAYFPATMQWGIAHGTRHLLLVGYSPRSFSGDEQDIPDDKKQTGEIMLWDARDRRLVPVMTATTANVFEVAWHPNVCGFVVGTSPNGLHIDHGVRTQVHVFRQDWMQHPDGAYSECQKLDCFAADINELTIVSNSMQSSYVTAACTDGKVYVWDMAQGDKPIHVLTHGAPLEEVLSAEDREREDTGVKFTTWGSDLSRLYTGSSDGVVKVWNIRNTRKPFVRDLLRAPGPISCGSFSPDRSKLAIGDATGRLFLFSVTEDENLEAQFTTVLPGTNRRVRRPKPFTPHPEPAPPKQDPDAMALDNDDDELDAATYARRKFLETQQVTLHSNPVIGAVQGPRYAASGLFLRDAHLDDDPAAPLLTKYERTQQESRHSVLGGAASSLRRRSLRRLVAPAADGASERRHRQNVARDFDAAALNRADLEELVRAGALLDIADEGEDWGFQYEDGPAADDDD